MASYREYLLDKKTDWQKVQSEVAKSLAGVQNVVNPNVKVPTLTELSGGLVQGQGTFGGQTGVPTVTSSTDNSLNWFEFLRLTLDNWGLGVLSNKAREFINQGFEPRTILLKVQETPEYEQRFSGNVARRKAGLSVLSPDVYLSTEDAYRSIMRQSGLPKDFYDTPEDFANFIAKDVSAAELKSRVDLGTSVVDNNDPMLINQLSTYYNLTKGEMIAYVLDPERSMPLIERQIKAAQIGAAAQRQDITVSAPVSEQLVGMGVTQSQAEQGFQAVAQVLPEATLLSSIYRKQVDGGYGQQEAIAETFGTAGAAEATRKRKQLTELEKSAFAGQAGVGTPSLSRTTQGQF